MLPATTSSLLPATVPDACWLSRSWARRTPARAGLRPSPAGRRVPGLRQSRGFGRSGADQFATQPVQTRYTQNSREAWLTYASARRRPRQKLGKSKKAQVSKAKQTAKTKTQPKKKEAAKAGVKTKTHLGSGRKARRGQRKLTHSLVIFKEALIKEPLGNVRCFVKYFAGEGPFFAKGSPPPRPLPLKSLPPFNLLVAAATRNFV